LFALRKQAHYVGKIRAEGCGRPDWLGLYGVMLAVHLTTVDQGSCCNHTTTPQCPAVGEPPYPQLAISGRGDLHHARIAEEVERDPIYRAFIYAQRAEPEASSAAGPPTPSSASLMGEVHG
jgi:hypothetical protein